MSGHIDVRHFAFLSPEHLTLQVVPRPPLVPTGNAAADAHALRLVHDPSGTAIDDYHMKNLGTCNIESDDLAAAGALRMLKWRGDRPYHQRRFLIDEEAALRDHINGLCVPHPPSTLPAPTHPSLPSECPDLVSSPTSQSPQDAVTIPPDTIAQGSALRNKIMTTIRTVGPLTKASTARGRLLNIAQRNRGQITTVSDKVRTDYDPRERTHVLWQKGQSRALAAMDRAHKPRRLTYRELMAREERARNLEPNASTAAPSQEKDKTVIDQEAKYAIEEPLPAKGEEADDAEDYRDHYRLRIDTKDVRRDRLLYNAKAYIPVEERERHWQRPAEMILWQRRRGQDEIEVVARAVALGDKPEDHIDDSEASDKDNVTFGENAFAPTTYNRSAFTRQTLERFQQIERQEKDSSHATQDSLEAPSEALDSPSVSFSLPQGPRTSRSPRVTLQDTAGVGERPSLGRASRASRMSRSASGGSRVSTRRLRPQPVTMPTTDTLSEMELASYKETRLVTELAARTIGSMGYTEEMEVMLRPAEVLPARCTYPYLHPLSQITEIAPPVEGAPQHGSGATNRDASKVCADRFWQMQLEEHLPPLAPPDSRHRCPTRTPSPKAGRVQGSQPPRICNSARTRQTKATTEPEEPVIWTRQLLDKLMQQKEEALTRHMEEIGITMPGKGRPKRAPLSFLEQEAVRQAELVASGVHVPELPPNVDDDAREEAEKQLRQAGAARADLLLYRTDSMLFGPTGESMDRTTFQDFPFEDEDAPARPKMPVEQDGPAQRMARRAEGERKRLEQGVIARQLLYNRRNFDQQDDPQITWREWRRSAGFVAAASTDLGRTEDVEEEITERMDLLLRLAEDPDDDQEVSLPVEEVDEA